MKTYILSVAFFLVAASIQAQELKVVEGDVSSRVLKVAKFEDLGKYRDCITIEQKYLSGCGYMLKLTNKCTKAVDVWWATERESGDWNMGTESIKVGKMKETSGCIQTGRYVVLTKEANDYLSKVPTEKELKSILSNN
ncbi:MAG: hypothetical protein JNL40_03620 [Cyclobacteriaceae bacterium]|nr:hypothetical protein [Cyclobacteriaceae bacterium]